MKTKVIPAIGLDAGSKYTRCVVCAVENGRLRFLGGGVAESRGWAHGIIADQGDVTDSMLVALREAEQNAQFPIAEVVLGAGGYTIRGANTRGYINLGRPREIEQKDINRVMRRAYAAQLPEDRMVLQMCQQDFMVDDHPGHRDPRRMLANELEVNVHLITASTQEHNCLLTAAQQAHVKVEETVFEALAACHAAVKEPQRREGVAVIDIGSQSTDLVVYYGEALQLAWSLRVGGDHFTRDVVHGLHVGFEDAEVVKEEYGSAMFESTPENSMVEVPPHEDRPPREVPRRVVNKILESRAVDLFGLVYRELERVGMHTALAGGAVLTGGGAELADLCPVAEAVLGCQARKGLPAGIRDWPQGLYGPQWATVAGLAMYSARLKYQGELERQSVGLLGRILR